MSPLKIAKAPRSPLIEKYGSNGDIERLLRGIGRKQARYGEISTSHGLEKKRVVILRGGI